MRLNIIKKCVNNMFLLLLTMAIVIVILWSYYYIYENQHSIPFLDSCFWLKIVEDYWNIVVAIATVVAAFWAYRAYMQSVKTRKHSSFDSIFTQLLSNMQSYINKATLQTTIVKAPWVKVYNRDYSTFLNFFNIYTEYMYITGQRILDKDEITGLWKVYTKNLVNQSDFSNCFKYFYHIVDTVCQSPLDDARRKQYIGIIQAQLNYDILFCYLINQIVYPYRNSNKEPYPKLLREYDFFKDLCKHGDYGAIIKSTINEDILKPFLHKETLKSLFKK